MKVLEGVSEGLVEKYNLYAFDYIEYPHKSFWSERFSEEDFKAGLRDLGRSGNPPLVLYVHIPFCPQMCWFCVCHFLITHDYERVKGYLNLLYREVDLLVRFCKENQITLNFKEVHLGGGSPTMLQEREFVQLKEKLSGLVDFQGLEEFAIEVDPRRVDRDRMRFYRREGISRVSFGVQDFDLEVQKAVNRVQPPELLENLLAPEIRDSFESVNFDLLCGLPRQTAASMRRTIERVIGMQPDRIALSFLHYTPKVAPHQVVMKKNGELPGFQDRKRIFEEAVDALLRAGYVRTGFEHFARPTDACAQAVEKGTVQYNSLGATPGRCTQLVGVGLHSYSRLGDRYYAQNVYEQAEYETAVNAGRFPVFRGHRLDEDDQIRREIIHRLRTLFALDRGEIEQQYGLKFERYFEGEERVLEEFERDGMVEARGRKIVITELGKNFSNLAGRIFDKYSRGSRFPHDFFDGPRVAL